MQSVPLTIKVASLIPAHGEVYIVSDVRHNDGFILQHRHNMLIMLKVALNKYSVLTC